MVVPDFRKHAEASFRFLLEEWPFTLSNSDERKVTFTSSNVRIDVTYSTRAEVDVLVDEIPASHEFQFRLFLLAYHPHADAKLGYGIADTDQEVASTVELFADAMRRYGKPVLEHDADVFSKMKTVKWWQLPKS